MQQITHHGVEFAIDTMDWTVSECGEIAEEALIDGLINLSAHDVRRIADHWADDDSECESRNADDEIAKLVESIESAAYDKATEGWEAMPVCGHNCSISIAR